MDIKLFAELAKIENALVERHSCTEGLAWCGENRGTLKKTKVTLFHLFLLNNACKRITNARFRTISSSHSVFKSL